MTNRNRPAAAAPVRAGSTSPLASVSAVRLAAQAERVAALAAFRTYAASHTFTAEQRGEVVPFTRVDVEWMLSYDPTAAAAQYRTLVATGSILVAGEAVRITAL